MEGRELIVKSRTGSGKTLAFLLPLFEMIDTKRIGGRNQNPISSIILEPTRELAIQVQQQVRMKTDIRSVVVTGGSTSNAY